MIQVTRSFAGRLTGERRIVPGVYVADDPALFGLAAYLVENGFAVQLDPPPPKHIEDTVRPTGAESTDKPKRGRGK